MVDAELERFKFIDLRAYAAAQGYVLDRRASWRGSAVMRRHTDGDKIVIKRNEGDGHFVYYSYRRTEDNGTIIDFVQFRQNLTIGAVRKELRPWIGAPPVPVPTFSALPATAKDRLAVETAYARMPEVRRHPYLEGERALPASLLESDRFAGCIRMDVKPKIKYPNAVFAHFDQQGLCGYEIKNVGFTGFSPGGTKGLFMSRTLKTDRRLAIFESAIDALSFAALFPDDRTRYASLAGKPTPMQKELIRAASALMPKSSVVTAAMDADAAGREMAEIVREAVKLTGRSDLQFEILEPQGGLKDWNDVLRSAHDRRQLRPCPAAPGIRLS
jgi:hypothetical protein